MFKRSARLTALAVAATALTAVAGAPAASAQEPQARKAPCTPSKFDNTMARYVNVKKRGNVTKLMPRSEAMYSPTDNSSMSISYGKSKSWTSTGSAELKTSFGAFGTAVEASIGLSISHSREVSRSVTYTLAIPAKHWGWFHPVLSGIRVTATKEVINLKCNRVVSRRFVTWTGPLRDAQQDMIGKVSRSKPV